jgi:hypothetical protein
LADPLSIDSLLWGARELMDDTRIDRKEGEVALVAVDERLFDFDWVLLWRSLALILPGDVMVKE